MAPPAPMPCLAIRCSACSSPATTLIPPRSSGTQARDIRHFPRRDLMALSLGVTAVASASAGSVPTPSRTPPAGSTIGLCGDWNAGGPFVSFTDSKGNTWTPIETELGSSPVTRMYYATNIIGGTGHTFTLNITSAGQPSIWMVEILSDRTMVILDLGTRQTDASSPFDSPGILTTAANAFLVGFIGGGSAPHPATHTAGAGFPPLDPGTKSAAFL